MQTSITTHQALIKKYGARMHVNTCMGRAHVRVHVCVCVYVRVWVSFQFQTILQQSGYRIIVLLFFS